MRRGMMPLLLAGAPFTPFAGAVSTDAGIITSDRPWLAKAEFRADESLHARHGQTVVLHLEAGGQGRQVLQVNVVRLLFESDRHVSFSIPVDEPHMVRLKLQRMGGRTLLNGRRGQRCESFLLPAGRYRLQVYHDADSVPAGGPPAFLHLANRPLTATQRNLQQDRHRACRSVSCAPGSPAATGHH